MQVIQPLAPRSPRCWTQSGPQMYPVPADGSVYIQSTYPSGYQPAGRPNLAPSNGYQDPPSYNQQLPYPVPNVTDGQTDYGMNPPQFYNEPTVEIHLPAKSVF